MLETIDRINRLQAMIDADGDNEYVDSYLSALLDRGELDSDEERVLTLIEYLRDQEGEHDIGPNDLEVCGDELTTGKRSWLVLTDDEADSRWDDCLEEYIDCCLYIPDHLEPYFDREKWKRDARYDGRGHTLSCYDGCEHEQRDYYIYRTN
jgi:hypothetical protein